MTPRMRLCLLAACQLLLVASTYATSDPNTDGIHIDRSADDVDLYGILPTDNLKERVIKRMNSNRYTFNPIDWLRIGANVGVAYLDENVRFLFGARPNPGWAMFGEGTYFKSRDMMFKVWLTMFLPGILIVLFAYLLRRVIAFTACCVDNRITKDDDDKWTKDIPPSIRRWFSTYNLGCLNDTGRVKVSKAENKKDFRHHGIRAYFLYAPMNSGYGNIWKSIMLIITAGLNEVVLIASGYYLTALAALIPATLCHLHNRGIRAANTKERDNNKGVEDKKLNIEAEDYSYYNLLYTIVDHPLAESLECKTPGQSAETFGIWTFRLAVIYIAPTFWFYQILIAIPLRIAYNLMEFNYADRDPAKVHSGMASSAFSIVSDEEAGQSTMHAPIESRKDLEKEEKFVLNLSA